MFQPNVVPPYNRKIWPGFDTNKGIPKKVILLIVITVLLSTIVVDYAKARDCNCKKRNGSLDTHFTLRVH